MIRTMEPLRILSWASLPVTRRRAFTSLRRSWARRAPNRCASSAAPQEHHTANVEHQTTPTDTSHTLVVALSGGVDSSVAAALLKNHQHPDHASNCKITAVHMTNWNHQDADEQQAQLDTCYEQEYKDAERVALHLGLPLIRQRLEAEYWTKVFEPYLDDLIHHGKMGNPDTACNMHIKFGALRENLQAKYGAHSWLATGHYARLWHTKDTVEQFMASSGIALRDYTDLVQEHIENDQHHNQEWLWQSFQKTLQEKSSPWLLAAADKSKDQSYFLTSCSSNQLRHVVFPLGDYYKKEQPHGEESTNTTTQETMSASSLSSPTVRDLAHTFHLPTANKRESMGICFIGKRRSWKDFVQEYLPPQEKEVDFVHIETRKVLGKSPGPSHPTLYTIGRGAQLGGMAERYFVADYDIPQNIVWVCPGTHHPALYADCFTVRDMNWIHPYTIPQFLFQEGGVLRCHCRIRHLQPLTECEVSYDSQNKEYTIRVDQPIRGITPGQMLALYVADDLVCLGGGTIQSRGPSFWKQGKKVEFNTEYDR